MRHLFLLLALMMGVSLWSQPGIEQYETMIIERIDVEPKNCPPGTQFNPQSVLMRMNTETGRIFSQMTFDQDLKTLAQDFDDVEPLVRIANGRLHITLQVTLKPVIRSIQWFGYQDFTTSKLQTELGIKPGEIFERVSFNRAFQGLKKFYMKKGYFEASLRYDVDVDCVTNEVDIFVSIEEGRCGNIEEISFINFTACEKKALEEMLMTKTWFFFTSWFTESGLYNEEMVQQDQMVIVNYLQNQGYADADVDIRIQESCRSNKIIIEIVADKGALYSIGTITIEGNTLFTEDEIRNVFCVQEGDFFSPDNIRESALNASELYGTYGYIDAIVDFEPVLDDDAPCYNLHFVIEEGEPYRVGLIKILGNCCTDTHVILHESLLVPGDIFNIKKLKKTEERIRSVGYFSSVNVYTVRNDETSCLGPNFRDVHIEVEETSTGNATAFLGFSSLENIFGGVTLSEKNFNYKGISRMMRHGIGALRGGGEYLHTTISVGVKSRRYGLSWTKPYFNDTPWVVGFDIDRNNIRYVSNDYDISSWSLVLHAKRQINDFVRYGTYIRFRNSDVHLDGDAISNPQLVRQAKNSGLVTAIGNSLSYDSTDCPRAPTTGFRSSAEFEMATLFGRKNEPDTEDKKIFSHHHRQFYFASFGYLNTWYFPITDSTVFKTRFDTRLILPFPGTSFSSIPIDERLFLGGNNNVRGYQDYLLGPKYKDTLDPKGGTFMNLFSLEYTWRFSKRFEPFVFFDAGNLSDTLKPRIRSSTGVGVRITVFEGGPAITLGYGCALNGVRKHLKQPFFFSLGGNF